MHGYAQKFKIMQFELFDCSLLIIHCSLIKQVVPLVIQ